MTNEFFDAIKEVINGRAFKIFDCSLGTSIEKFPLNMITSADANFSFARIYKEDGVYRIHDDGSETMLNLKESISLVFKHGGWLRSDGLACKYVDNKLERIFVRKPLLDSMIVETEDELVSFFGEPEYKKSGRSGTEYYYFSKMLCVAWSVRKHSIEHIGIGDFKIPLHQRTENAMRGIFYIGGLREVKISLLEQRNIHRGIIAGSPTKDMHDQIIERCRLDAKSRFTDYQEPYFLAPPRITITSPPESRFQRESMPKIACMALLESFEPACDASADGSGLVLVWFQDELALPIDKDVVASIENLEWEKYATDYFF